MAKQQTTAKQTPPAAPPLTIGDLPPVPEPQTTRAPDDDQPDFETELQQMRQAFTPAPDADPAPPEPVIARAPVRPVAAGRSALRGDLREAPRDSERRRKGHIDRFALPQGAKERFEDAGWSVEFKRHTTFGQEDASYQVALAENAWEPVTTSELPGYMPAGYNGAIVRDGLMLMKRPKYLTEEARREDAQAAKDVIKQKEAQLGQAPQGHAPRDHALVRPKINRSVERFDIPD